jgi:protein-disulfide isomerase
MKKIFNLIKRAIIQIQPPVFVIIFIIIVILSVDKYGKSQRQIDYENTRKNFKVVNEDTDSSINVDNIDNVFGKSDAKVTILEYSRFGCPHCVNFHKKNVDKIKKDYIDTGKVKYTIKLMIDLENGNDLLGVVLPSCLADENEKFKLIKLLFESSNEWLNKTIAIEQRVEKLRELFLTINKDNDIFNNCISNINIANIILNDQRKDNVEITPTFIINKKKYSGDMEYEEFKKIIDDITEDDYQ